MVIPRREMMHQPVLAEPIEAQLTCERRDGLIVANLDLGHSDCRVRVYHLCSGLEVSFDQTKEHFGQVVAMEICPEKVAKDRKVKGGGAKLLSRMLGQALLTEFLDLVAESKQGKVVQTVTIPAAEAAEVRHYWKKRLQRLKHQRP